MDSASLGVMIPIVTVVGAFIMIIYLRKYENEERMAMIDKGLSLDFAKRSRGTSLPLRTSLLFIGAGVGLLMGYLLDVNFDMEEVAYFSMLFIFGGIGLGLAYVIEEKKLKDEKEKS